MGLEPKGVRAQEVVEVRLAASEGGEQRCVGVRHQPHP